VERRILGAGSNVLVSDFGLRGATLKLFGALACIRKLDENSRVIDVEVGAGASLKRFLAWCCANQCGGMQALVGIPASIGGAIRMNAGTLDGCISHGLTQVRLLHAGCMQWVDADTIPFSYRYSGIGPDDVIIAARFRLKRQDSLTIRTAYDEVEKKRRLSQPRLRSAGCFFRNPSTGYSAGALIDKAGCKGLCVGRAQVAQKHANFLVNKGGASARDILSLSYCVINAVWQKFSVNLRPEIKLWGVFPRCA
jgi:UDP-N-acetylmuramate dehydrogenase